MKSWCRARMYNMCGKIVPVKAHILLIEVWFARILPCLLFSYTVYFSYTYLLSNYNILSIFVRGYIPSTCVDFLRWHWQHWDVHIAFGQTLEFRFGAKSRKSEESVDFSNKWYTCNIHGYENLNWFGDPGKNGVLLKLGEDVSEFQFIQTIDGSEKTQKKHTVLQVEILAMETSNTPISNYT